MGKINSVKYLKFQEIMDQHPLPSNSKQSRSWNTQTRKILWIQLCINVTKMGREARRITRNKNPRACLNTSASHNGQDCHPEDLQILCFYGSDELFTLFLTPFGKFFCALTLIHFFSFPLGLNTIFCRFLILEDLNICQEH